MIDIASVSVKELMSESVVYVNKDDKLSDIISKMSSNDIRELPVIDGNQAIGIVTYGNLLRKKNLPLTSKAEVVMQGFPQLSEYDRMNKGIELMLNYGLKDLPVTRNGKLVGIVYRKDVLTMLTKVKELRRRPLGTIMTPEPETVSKDDDVRKALSILRGLDEKNLPVVDDRGRIIGVIGMKDIMTVLRKPKEKISWGELKADKEPVQILVGSIMTRPPITAADDTSLGDALKLMIKKDISTLFVVEDSKLIGVVTLKDVLEQAMSLQPSEEGVYVQLTGLEVEDPDIYDSLYSVIQKGLVRISKVATPMLFNAHIATYHHEGLRSKYSVHARLTTEHGLLFSKTTDWDIFKSMNTLLEGMERELRKRREKVISERKKGKR